VKAERLTQARLAREQGARAKLAERLVDSVEANIARSRSATTSAI